MRQAQILIYIHEPGAGDVAGCSIGPCCMVSGSVADGRQLLLTAGAIAFGQDAMSSAGSDREQAFMADMAKDLIIPSKPEEPT